MDITPIDPLIRALEDAEPAEAPDRADEIARLLAEALESGDDPEESR